MRFGGFRHSVFALLYSLVVVVFGTASADAVAKSSGNQGQFTKVGTIEPSISPSAPPPANRRFTLSAKFIRQLLTVRNVRYQWLRQPLNDVTRSK